MTFLRKKFQLANGTSIVPSLVFTVIYNLIAVIVGLIYIAFDNQFRILLSTDPRVILLAVILAITVSITTVITVVGSLYGSLSIIMMMAILGQLLFSAVYGLVFDGTRNAMSVWMVIGLILSIIIAGLNFFDQGATTSYLENSKKNKRIYRLLCLVIFITNGGVLIIYSLMTKHFPSYGYVDFIALYSFFGLIVTLMTLIIIVLIKRKKGVAVYQSLKINPTSLWLIALYAVLFFGGEFASLYTTGIIPIVVQAPLSFALQLIIISLFDTVVFKTKLTGINYLQMGLALICSVMFVL